MQRCKAQDGASHAALQWMAGGAPMSAVSHALAVSCDERDNGADTLQRHDELNRFFAGIERRALRFAEIAVRDRDDALDLVQTAMIRLAQRYATKPADEWSPLFYRILKNAIRDFHRRQAVRNRVMVWFGRPGADGKEYDPVAEAVDTGGRAPDEHVETGEAMHTLEEAVRDLPARQREAFMLRAFEGLDVRETATAMGCTTGSVKTHYSRAVHTLREALGEHWDD